MKYALTFVLYHAKDGWRWHAKRSGRIVAESGEAYTRRRDAHKAASNFFHACRIDARLVLPNDEAGDVRRFLIAGAA